MLSSASKPVDDLDFPIIAPATKDLIEYSFYQSGGAGTNLEEVDMAPKPKPLGKKKTAVVSPVQQARNLILAFSSLMKGQPSAPSSPYISICKGKLYMEGPSLQKK